MSIFYENVKGTQYDRPPYPYESWKNFWCGTLELKWAKYCGVENCNKSAEMGGHIKGYGRKTKRFILPMCCYHNQQKAPFLICEKIAPIP